MTLRLNLSLLTAFTCFLTFSSSTCTGICAPANLTGTALAAPSLEYDFHMKVDLNPAILVGAGTWGTRKCGFY